MIESLSPDDTEPSHLSSNLSLIQQPITDISLIVPINPFKFNKFCISLFIFIFIIIPLMWLSTILLPFGYFYFKLPINHDIHIYIYTFIYYLVLLITFGIGFICQQYKKSRKLLRRFLFVYTLRFCGKEKLFKLQFGQFILLLIGLSTLIFIAFYFNSYPTSDITQKLDPFNTEKVIRSAGIISTIFCGLCLIPIARGNKIMHYCFGISFESGIKYHRVLGGAMLIFASIHFIGFIILLIKNDYYKVIHIFSKEMPFNGDNVYQGQNWTISLMQIVVLFIFFPFIITLKRRKLWEIFFFFFIFMEV